MQGRRDSGPEGYSKGGTACRQEGCRTAEMLDRSVTGKVGCRKGGVPGSIGQKLVQVMTTGRVYTVHTHVVIAQDGSLYSTMYYEFMYINCCVHFVKKN